MKPIRFTLTLLAALLSSFLFSCEKAENELYPGDQVVLKQIRNDKNEVIARFSYNADGSLKASSEYSELNMNKKWSTANYEYVGGILSKTTGFIPGNMLMSSIIGATDHTYETEFTYVSGRLDEQRFKYVFKELLDLDYQLSHQFAYPDERTVEMTTYYIHPAANSVVTVFVYLFNEKGNIVEKRQYADMAEGVRTLHYLEQYEYDDKPNPFRAHHNFEASSVNNIVEKRVNYDPLNSSSEFVFRYTYEYNSVGLPAKRATTNPNETVVTEYFDYFNL
jgi:hypothetical protein